MVHYTLYGKGDITLDQLLELGKSKDLDALKNVSALNDLNDSVTSNKLENRWVDIFGAGQAQVKAIAESFGLHPVTEEDILEETREKMEVFSKYQFFVFDEIKYQANSSELNTVQIKVVVLKNCVLSFHSKMSECFPKTVRRLNDEYDDQIESTIWIAYGLLDEVINLDLKVAEEIVRETRLLDSLVLRLDQSDQGNLLHRISSCRRKLMDIRTSLWAKREIVKAMEKNYSNLVEYLRDVLDHVIDAIEKLTVSVEVLNHLDNVYLTRLTLEVSQASANMNQTMNSFSAVATIFLPLSVLTGLWGMNVRVPGQLGDPGDSLVWFYSIAGTLTLIAVTTSIYFHRHKWL